ncbi:MAG: zinc ribbon domain-containing protein [Thermoplasmata archaeon]
MESTTFLAWMVILLLGVIGLIIAVWYYFEKSKPDRIKKARADRSLDTEDKAYNSVVSTKSICRVLGEKGYNMSQAEVLLERAELALEANDSSKALQLTEKAKERIESAKKKGIQPIDATSDTASFDELEDQKVIEFEERKERLRSLPENYMESKFQIEVARDMVEEKGDKEARRLLGIAEEKYSTEDYSGALSYAVKCKKWVDEDSAGLLSGQKVDRIKDEGVVDDVVVKNISAPEEEEVYECMECGAVVSEDHKFCNKCGAKIEFNKTCSECGTEIRSSYNFCPECGGELSVLVYECPECGTEVDENIKFCPNCGVGLE